MIHERRSTKKRKNQTGLWVISRRARKQTLCGLKKAEMRQRQIEKQLQLPFTANTIQHYLNYNVTTCRVVKKPSPLVDKPMFAFA